MFRALGKVPSFDFHGRPTIVDQEKSIDTEFKAKISNARIILQMIHVKKNLAGPMGKEKSTIFSFLGQSLLGAGQGGVFYKIGGSYFIRVDF